MEDKNSSKNNTNQSKVFILLAFIAFSVIVGGLFFNSQSAGVNSRVIGTSSGLQEMYFTAVELPKKLDFAGEIVPLENFDIRESLDREMLIVANYHSQTIFYLKKTTRYFSILEPILKKYNVPDDFKFLALAESGFFDKVVSPAGAVGIWQFLKDTAIESGLEVNDEVDERYHIEKATEAACKHLKYLYTKYGNWTMVAASYNAGLAGMNRQVDVQDSKNYYDLLLNEETSRYIFRILALKLVISDPEKYGFKVSDDEKYPIIPFHEVKISGSINSFTDFARANNINYKLFKQFNPWLRKPDLKNLKKITYIVKIPDAGKYRSFSSTENSDL